MKKTILSLLITITFSILTGCSVADDIVDTFDAVECANLINNRLNVDNDTCAEIIADINIILSGSCNDFITSEQREQLEFIRDNCEDN